MGGSTSKIEKREFTCNNKYSIKREPLKFRNLEHKRCIFFSNDYYKENKHIPSEILTVKFDSTINNLENDIENQIKKVYDILNNVTSAKILNPIYVAFSRKLQYVGSIFDNPSLQRINVNTPTNNQSLAIKDFITSFLNEYPSYKERYMSLPSNKYDFVNNNIVVIIYFPFLTKNYKYITNFTDIINSSSFFLKILLDNTYNGLPDVNTFDEDKIRKELNNGKRSQQEINALINELKKNDEKNFRLSDDLLYLCNEGGCVSDIGEDFNTLLPSLAKNDSDNSNNATNQSPFLPNKCLAQTIRYKCGILAPENNKPLNTLMTSEPIMNYLTESLSKYIINKECRENKNADKGYCERTADKNPNIQETPIDIINKTFSYQLRNQFSSDYNKPDVNHYSIDYSINIIKELLFLRNKYPGIPEIVFPIYKYIGSNDYTINPPWGPYFITSYNIINYNENILVNNYKFSINQRFYLKMDNIGNITVNYTDTNQIFYYLNLTNINNPLSMSFTDSINIIYIDNISNNHTTKRVSADDVKLIIRDDNHREPYNFYLNDEGKIRVFANGFIDATNKSFIDYIDNKINEYNQYGKNNIGTDIYKKIYNSNNKIDKSKIDIDGAIYLDDPTNVSNINIRKL